MKLKPTKRDKREIRQEMHITRPPRLEGKVKEAMMQPVRKAKSKSAKPQSPRKMQGITVRQRKDYQLGSKH